MDGGPLLVDGATIPVTVSIGAAVATGATISDLEILAAADAALYQAKRAGRNRTVLSDLVLH